MVTSACAAPLIGDFGGFVALMPRNEPPFTCVHSHAGAQKSSGVFFSDTDGEWCRKWPSGRRNALRASRAVRARDVMVNSFYNILINLNRFQNEYYCLQSNGIHMVDCSYEKFK